LRIETIWVSVNRDFFMGNLLAETCQKVLLLWRLPSGGAYDPILAPHEIQRRVVSDKTGTYSSARPGKNKSGRIDSGGEMVAKW